MGDHLRPRQIPVCSGVAFILDTKLQAARTGLRHGRSVNSTAGPHRSLRARARSCTMCSPVAPFHLAPQRFIRTGWSQGSPTLRAVAVEAYSRIARRKSPWFTTYVHFFLGSCSACVCGAFGGFSGGRLFHQVSKGIQSPSAFSLHGVPALQTSIL